MSLIINRLNRESYDKSEEKEPCVQTTFNVVMPMYKEIVRTTRETKHKVDDIYEGLLKL